MIYLCIRRRWYIEWVKWVNANDYDVCSVNNKHSSVCLLLIVYTGTLLVCCPAVEMRESVENSQLQIISFEDCKYVYLIHAWSDKPFKGTDVYQTLPSLHRGSFEITLTVPLKVLFAKNERRYRHTAKNNCFWSLLFTFLSVARKLLKNYLYSRT